MTLAPDSGKRETAKKRPGKRGGRGFHRPAETARVRLAETAAAHGFAEPEVLLRWSEIVGENLAGLCTPVRVTYPREQGLAATLIVRTQGARAPEVAHLEPRIIERVNQFYGYRAVGRMKVTQTMAANSPTPAGFAEKLAPFKAQESSIEPNADDAARAADLTKGVENDALREALTRMGAHVLANSGPRRA